MDFNFSSEQAALRDRVIQFCERQCSEVSQAQRDREPEYPAALHEAMGASGILGHCMPTAYGGSGGFTVEMCILNEELSRFSTGAATILFINGICAAVIALAGSEPQKECYLRGIAQGRVRFAFALTEPDAGSDAGGIQLQAAKKGESFILNGTKLYTTGASAADFILTVARTSMDEKASRGTSLLIVPRESAGLTITPLQKIAGNDIASCRVEYRDVRVAADACLGGENQGWPLLKFAGGVERLSVAASCVGTGRAALDEILTHVTTRKQFGQPIGSFQAIQHQVADLATLLECMRLMTYSAAWRVAQGIPAVKEVSMAKVFASEGINKIVTYGMRMLGAKSYLSDTPMPRRLRESMVHLYAGGTCEIQRNIIAKSLGL